MIDFIAILDKKNNPCCCKGLSTSCRGVEPQTYCLGYYLVILGFILKK